MSINSIEEAIQKTKKEIENFNRQLSSESINEATNSQKLVKVFRSIGSSTTESSLRNRLNDIGRYGNEIVTSQQRKAELQKKIASRTSQLHIFEKRLEDEKYKNSLRMAFDFPEELKTPCEQYLLYFAQFLKDLGIKATSNIEEEAGKVLFSITPTDDKEALDKIREALAVYLNLPASPIVYDDSFAAMRLQQQIENLQHSQRMAVRELQFNEKLLIAQSGTIHEKNTTISQQQSVIEQQNEIIEKITDPAIMMNSVENKEELEKFCEGFEVGKSEFLMKQIGVHLNPATVLKTIGKKILGKDDKKKSVLGLDEEKEI